MPLNGHLSEYFTLKLDYALVALFKIKNDDEIKKVKILFYRTLLRSIIVK